MQGFPRGLFPFSVRDKSLLLPQKTAMENTDEKAAMLALNRIFGFNPRCGKALLDSFPDARSVFYADRSRLRTVTGPNADYLDRLVPAPLIRRAKSCSTSLRPEPDLRVSTKAVIPPC